MLVATFGEGAEWAGKTISYSDGVFSVEDHGELSADEVMHRGRQGELDWASEAMPFWVAALAHTSPPPEKPATPAWVWAVVAVAAVAMIVVAGVGFFLRDAMRGESSPAASGSPQAAQTASPEEPAGVGAVQGKGTWVSVLTWSGGGRGTLVTRSDTFEARGSRQRIGTFWDRVGSRPFVPPPQWRVVDARDGSVAEIVTATVQRQLTPLQLEPGTYYLASTATDCIWRVILQDLE